MEFVITKDIKELDGEIKKLSFSDRKNKSFEYSKITARPFSSKKGELWQIEKTLGAKVFHQNLSKDEFLAFLETDIKNNFRQGILTAKGKTIQYTIFPDKTKRKEMKNEITSVSQSHDKEKSYILKQGENIPALVDLGIFSKDFHLVKGKADKFKQINRFVEIIDDAFAEYEDDEITILDFGCGKSYLTFIIYYYFTEIKKISARVIGYDLKTDVVKKCNDIARNYGYDKLSFFVNDVTKGESYSGKVDMVVSLHACNEATDYALFHAISHNVKNIFSVPCCQHEICESIKRGGDFDLLLSHGLIKERFSALLTDSIRAEILLKCGYETDIIEFVDFESSPKNLMIRGKKTKKESFDFSKCEELERKYRFNQRLLTLMKEYIK